MRIEADLGFGGTIPCAQKKGHKKFYELGQDPETLLVEGKYDKLPIFFGANSHEGLMIFGCKIFHKKI